MERDGFAIALAWPETYCKQSGAWYDYFAEVLKISENNYYKVGHAALILVNAKGNLFYYDFGRYHAPFGCGRVRSQDTDPELELFSSAKCTSSKIENFHEILKEVSTKKEFHGEGKLIASYTKIYFDKAKKRADKMLHLNPWKYGPFIFSGTNCSRFVRSIIMAGDPIIFTKINLLTQLSVTASPYFNVKKLGEIHEIETPNLSQKPKSKPNLKSVLTEPENKPHPHAKWFSGEGAGSWFHIKKMEKYFLVKKYAEDHTLESTYKMIANPPNFNLEKEFIIKFPCHALEKK